MRTNETPTQGYNRLNFEGLAKAAIVGKQRLGSGAYIVKAHLEGHRSGTITLVTDHAFATAAALGTLGEFNVQKLNPREVWDYGSHRPSHRPVSAFKRCTHKPLVLIPETLQQTPETVEELAAVLA